MNRKLFVLVLAVLILLSGCLSDIKGSAFSQSGEESSTKVQVMLKPVACDEPWLLWFSSSEFSPYHLTEKEIVHLYFSQALGIKLDMADIEFIEGKQSRSVCGTPTGKKAIMSVSLSERRDLLALGWQDYFK